MADIGAGIIGTSRTGNGNFFPAAGFGPALREKALPRAGAETNGHLRGDHAVVVARLLEAADSALEKDPPSARDCIARAMAILRPEQAGEERSRAIQAPRSLSSPARGGLSPWQIRAVTDYVGANLVSRLRGADMARVAKLSGSYFARAFKDSFGETPHGYVMRRRIDHAQALMLNTDQPLSAIAVDCGFADQAHFCRWFLRVTGQRPKSWRVARRQLA